MSFPSGHTLAHYELLELIGKGGMGDVYRARDSKLGRDVAIKVLPDELARDEERRRRFQREAKVLASLNHPNIASIYGFETSGSTQYLVLELVDGETLAERIERGPIPFEEALEIASKIAVALEAAHEQGIVHRDLKPANVKITPDDDVKVLDFGLAKAFVEDAPGADSSTSPTITRDATRVGVILGTAAYMSPEQAKGKRVDKRADIWAFGAVLYEMLTGVRAFVGEDVSDTLAAVLRAEPQLDELPPQATPALRTALARCLEKNLAERMRDIGDVRLAMSGAFESGVARGGAIPKQRRAWPLAVGLAIVCSLAVWALKRPPAPERPVVQFVVTAPPNPGLLFQGGGHDVALSPDGATVVYRTGPGAGGASWLYVQRIAELDGTLLENTRGATSPFFSPDGQWIGFLSGAVHLEKIPTTGGGATNVTELTGGIRGASWGADGTIVFGDMFNGDLRRVSANGGEPSVLLARGALEGVNELAVFRWPAILPDGETVLFSLDTPGTHPRYVDTGHILYADSSRLRAAPFDVHRYQLTGTAATVLDGVMIKPGGGMNYAVAQNGSMIYTTGSSLAENRLVWVDRNGHEEPIGTEALDFDQPRVSPDDRRIAVEIYRNENADLYVVDPERGTNVRVTRAPGDDTSPLWAPDGTAIVFTSQGDGSILRIAADGSGDVERLVDTVGGNPPYPTSWTPDGRTLLFYESGGPTVGDIYSLNLDSSKVTKLLTQPDVQEAHPVVSPDGKWLAYTGNESGRSEIYVRPFPNVDERRVLVSPSGGNEPLWSPNGTELFYWNDDARAMMAVPVELEPTFRAGVATKLFQGDYLFPAAGRHYDVSHDGRRFLMVIWAFGCCLHEALTAQKAFDGETVGDIISAVLRAEPSEALEPVTLRPLIRRCLTKDARQRFRDIGDVRIELQALSAAPLDERPPRAKASRLTAAALLIVGLAAGWLVARAGDGGLPPPSPKRFVITEALPRIRNPVFSPDGRELTFIAGSVRQLYRRALDRFAAEPIEGTVNAGGLPPFYSPDGAWIGFGRGSRLLKISPEGGAPVENRRFRSMNSSIWRLASHPMARSSPSLKEPPPRTSTFSIRNDARGRGSRARATTGGRFGAREERASCSRRPAPARCSSSTAGPPTEAPKRGVSTRAPSRSRFRGPISSRGSDDGGRGHGVR